MIGARQAMARYFAYATSEPELLYPRATTTTTAKHAVFFVPPPQTTGGSDNNNNDNDDDDDDTSSSTTSTIRHVNPQPIQQTSRRTTIDITSTQFITHTVQPTTKTISIHGITISRSTTFIIGPTPSTTMAEPSESTSNGIQTVTIIETPTPAASSTSAAASTTAASTPSPIATSSSSGISKGSIAGVAVGVGASLIIAAVLGGIWLLMRRRKKRRQEVAAGAGNEEGFTDDPKASKETEGTEAAAAVAAHGNQDLAPPQIFELDTSDQEGKSRPVSELPDTGPMPELSGPSAPAAEPLLPSPTKRQHSTVVSPTSPMSPVSNQFSVSELNPSEFGDIASERRLSHDFAGAGSESSDITVVRAEDQGHSGQFLTVQNLASHHKGAGSQSGQDSIGRSFATGSGEFVDAHENYGEAVGASDVGKSDRTETMTSPLTDARGSLYIPR